MTLRLADIVEFLSGKVKAEFTGNPDAQIERLSTLDAAGPNDLTFLSHPQYAAKLHACAAACVVVSPAVRDAALKRGAAIVVQDPYHAFALITQLWKQRHSPELVPAVHASAWIDPSATIADGVSIGPFVSVGANTVIASGASIGAHCIIGRQVKVGGGTRLAPRVTIADGCRIGERGIVHSGAVIGADGFGFARHQDLWIKIEQLGNVVIGDDVEIGANTCIDRGALEDTVLEDGVKLDNLVQIGHNVRIGKHTAMAGCAGIAGSARIGEHCTIGGGAIVLGHLTLADRVHISAASVVTRSILKPGNYTGLFPIDDNTAWEKNAATLKQLHTLRDRLKQAEKSILHMQKTNEKS